MRLAACLVLVALGCSGLPRAAGGAPGPQLVLSVRPDVRIVALDLVPGPDGLALQGRIVASQSLLAGGAPVRVQGLDAAGAVLFERSAVVRAGSAPGRWSGPLPAGLRADLPASPGLRVVKVTLPGD